MEPVITSITVFDLVCGLSNYYKYMKEQKRVYEVTRLYISLIDCVSVRV